MKQLGKALGGFGQYSVSDREFCDKHERFENSQLSDVDLARRKPTEGSAAHKSYLREIDRRKKAEK